MGICTKTRFAVMVVTLAVIGILIWQFVPEDKVDDAIDSVGLGKNDDVGENNGPTTSPPTLSPSSPPAFVFDQCGDCCNGLSSNCELRLDEVMFAGVHNAMATRENGFTLGGNHDFELESALEAGYRALNMDVCNCGGEYQLCHGICNFGARDPFQVFQAINAFLDNNPNEVLMIVLEINSGVDQTVDLNVFYDGAIGNVEGLVNKIYLHPDAQTPWPTLSELIAANSRLVMFHYNGPNCSQTSCPPGMLEWFREYGSETEYSFDTATDMQNYDLSCPIDRGPQNVAPSFFGINAFVTAPPGLPSKDQAEVVNTMAFLEDRVEQCTSRNGLNVANVVWVDFWSIGDLVELTQTLNAEYAASQ